MAKNQKPQQGGGQVTAIPQNCPVEGCGKKPRRAGFCDEHFVWFKEGLVSRDGKKPTDFDKKYQAFMRREKAA